MLSFSEGELQVSREGALLGKMRAGTVMGELAILYNCTRYAFFPFHLLKSADMIIWSPLPCIHTSLETDAKLIDIMIGLADWSSVGKWEYVGRKRKFGDLWKVEFLLSHALIWHFVSIFINSTRSSTSSKSICFWMLLSTSQLVIPITSLINRLAVVLLSGGFCRIIKTCETAVIVLPRLKRLAGSFVFLSDAASYLPIQVDCNFSPLPNLFWQQTPRSEPDSFSFSQSWPFLNVVHSPTAVVDFLAFSFTFRLQITLILLYQGQ